MKREGEVVTRHSVALNKVGGEVTFWLPVFLTAQEQEEEEEEEEEKNGYFDLEASSPRQKDQFQFFLNLNFPPFLSQTFLFLVIALGILGSLLFPSSDGVGYCLSLSLCVGSSVFFGWGDMAADFTTKVRLVRCPKCRLLLPELPDFHVYKCGGCGAILQAKNRQNGLRSRSTGLNGTVAAQMINVLGRVSEDKAPSGTSCSEIVPDLGECSSGQIDEKNRSKSSGEFSFERKSERDESKYSEGYESSSSSRKVKAPASEDCSLGRRNERNGSKSSESIESSSSSLKASASALGECSLVRSERDVSKSLEGNESSSLSVKAMAPASGECSLERRDGRYDRKSGSSSPKARAPDSGEYSLERSDERHESESSDSIESSSSSPKATTPDLGECLQRSRNRDEGKSSEGIEFGSSSLKAIFPDSGVCFSDHNNEENQNKFPKDEESSSLSHKVLLPESEEYTSIQNNRRDPDDSLVGDYGSEQLGDLNLTNENQNNQSDQNDYGDLGMEQLRVSKEVSSSMKFASNGSKESLPLTAASSEALKDDESLPSEVDIEVEFDSDSTSSSSRNAVDVEEHMPPRKSISSDITVSSPDEQSNAKVDINRDVDSEFMSSSAVYPGATRESGVAAHMLAQENSSSGTLTSSPNEQHKELHDSVQKSFDHSMSSSTFEATEFHSPKSEFSTAVRDRPPKSPATRIHQAYDGSVSSYEGIDDQFYNHDPHTLQDTYRAPDLVQSEERYRRDKFLAESMGNRVSELPTQARSSWSSMSDKNGDAMKYRNPNQNEMLPPRPGHPRRDHARVQRDEYMSRVASLQSDSLGGYGNGRFTNHMRNEFQSNSGYQSDMSASAASEKLALLRMVFELQNQVDNLNVQAIRQEKHIPWYHNYEASEEEFFHGLNHHRDLRRSRARSHYSQQQSKYTHIPFSSEATTSRHQVGSSFMHHYPQDRQYSAPMPLPIRCNTSGFGRVHPGYASSQWDTETMSDDQRQHSHEVKKYYGEKQQIAKRHFRPIAGGAPIVTCYNCFKPLQIPADFLLFKRKCHRLQCGACSKVLKFSLHKRIHIVPFGVDVIGPPPSEVEDHSYGGNVDPVSCSDDYGYGLSYCRSGSTEAGDAGNVAPSNSINNSVVHERTVSSGSNNPTTGRQEVALRRSQSQNKGKNPVARFLSARTSSNMLKSKDSKHHSSEIDEVPPKSKSPLHRLMGYRSPSQVIRGSGVSRSGTNSSFRS